MTAGPLELTVSKVTAAEILPQGTEIGVKNGKITCLGTDLPTSGSTKIVDARGAYVTPGGVDAHVHLDQDNSPTGDKWPSGSRSAIAGGNTTILAFAIQSKTDNSIWPAISSYHARAKDQSYCDYGFHLILTNPTEEVLEKELPKLISQGITSLKIYTTYLRYQLNDAAILSIMLSARALGLTIMVHCENSDIIAMLSSRLEAKGHTSPYFHSVSSPQIAEDEATYRLISLAELTDVPILIVHISSPEAASHVRRAQTRNLPIHAETCPQYLFLLSSSLQGSHHDVFEGAKCVCSPPLRHDPADLAEMWKGLGNGTFTIFSSDHAPSKYDHPNGKKRGLVKPVQPTALQLNGDGFVDGNGVSKTITPNMSYRQIPNGLPGVETRLPLLFNAAGTDFLNPDTKISLPRFVQLTSTNPAKLFGLDGVKGSIAPGYDADLVIWYAEGEAHQETESHNNSRQNGHVNGYTNGTSHHTAKLSESSNSGIIIRQANLHHDVDYTPYEGMEVKNWPRLTILRGRVVWDRDNGGVVGDLGYGRFLKRGIGKTLVPKTDRRAEEERAMWL
jgi:dihydropyrimidinase